MKWNWELVDWPSFKYDCSKIVDLEKQFLINVGHSMAFLKTIESAERNRFIVEILSAEGVESSKIEGEILDRESLQSSINKHFGLKGSSKQVLPKESGMANLLCDVYETFAKPLTHEMLYKWHLMIFNQSKEIEEQGKYRSNNEPMQSLKED